jgi:hypothetical protein
MSFSLLEVTFDELLPSLEKPLFVVICEELLSCPR